MRELDKALADIDAIRSQLAAGTSFRGYGPAALVVTALLALLTSLAQSLWLDDPAASPEIFIGTWALAAVFAAVVVGWEMRRRAHRHHSGLADAMIHQAMEQFLPAAAAGVLLTLVLWWFGREALWLLPGLWQMFVGMGIFAAVRTLPRGSALVGGWYMAAGLAVIALAAEFRALSPWSMGIPFLVGQLAMAAVIYRATRGYDAEA
jgi:hypothetical protein